jgi:hypothetical protein
MSDDPFGQPSAVGDACESAVAVKWAPPSVEIPANMK